MADDQPTFKVVDRRPFNPDGTPRELTEEEKREAERVAESLKIPAAETAERPAAPPQEKQEHPPKPGASTRPAAATTKAGGDPLDDPASFLSLIMSLASNAAASLGMMPHPVTGETGVDLKTA